jgi:cyclopropane fatty-acyl-phospholipid synthase-like methyltransferase
MAMTADLLSSDRFPRASKYNPEWLIAGVSGAANSLWMTEWLSEAMDLRPGMRVLDLGCGRGASSVFLRREFGVQVWATDLWFSAEDKLQRFQDAGVADSVFPIHADARSLPFAADFFDAIVSIDSFFYYGTDDMYLSYLARYVKLEGQIGIAGAGLMREFDGSVPEHLATWWTPDLAGLHSADWWCRHWEHSGVVTVERADTLAGGWQFWRDWIKVIAAENQPEIDALESDAGRYLGYVRAVSRRRRDAQLAEPILSVPAQYTKKPLLRDGRS